MTIRPGRARSIQGERSEDDHELIFRLAGSEPAQPEVQRALLERCLAPVLQFGQAILDTNRDAPSGKGLEAGTIETFVQSLGQLRALENQESLRPWILGIARKSFTRGRRRIPRLVQRSPAWMGARLRALPGQTRSAVGDIESRLQRLSPDELDLLLLRHLMGVGVFQLATMLGQKEGRIFRRLERAREMLFAASPMPAGSGSEHNRKHAKCLYRLKLAAEHSGLNQALAEIQPECPACARSLSDWYQACRKLESGLGDRWPEPDPTPEQLAAFGSQLARQPVALRRGEQVRIPWAEITAIAGVVLALVFILREAQPQGRAATLPLFPPSPIQGPKPVTASGGQFLDLSQTEDDVRAGVPAYHVSPYLAGDGRSLIFFYTGDMQAAGDRNGLPDLFRYDLDQGRLEWIQSPARAGSLEMSSSMTSDGRLLVYSASLSSIYGYAASGDCGHAPCSSLVLYDGSSGASEWLFSPDGSRQPEAISGHPFLTADGRFLAFFSSSTAAVEPAGDSCEPGTGAHWAAAYVLDRTAQDLAALPFCAETDQAAAIPSIEISFDGRFLLVRGKLELALPGDNAPRSELAYLLFDRTSGQVLDFPRQDGDSRSEARVLEAHFARGGNQLVFSTPTPGLDSADANSYVDLYLWDLEEGSLELISASPSGGASNGHSGSRFGAGTVAPTREFAVSSDGRFVAFVSQATDIVPGLSVDCGEFFRRACGNIYLRDRATGISRLLVEEPFQEAYFTDLSLSDDGDRVMFLEQRFGCYPAGYCTRMWVHEVESGRTYDPLSGEGYSRDWAAGNFGSDQSGVVYPSIVFASADTSISCQAVSPDGSLIAVGTTSGRIQVRDAVSGRVLVEEAYQHLPIFSLEFTPGGKQLYAVARDGSLARIDLASGEIELRTYETPERFQAMALAPSGELIALAGQEQLWLLRITDGDLKLVQFKRFEHGPLRALAFSPDASMLAVGDGDGQVWVLDLDTQLSLLRLAGHTGRVLVVEFSPDGRLLASSGEDRVLNLWRLQVTGGDSPSAERVFSALHPEWVGDLAFAPDAPFLVGVDFGHRVRFYPTDDFAAAQPGALIAGGVLLHVTFSPDGEALYLASASSVVRIERQQWQEVLR